MAITLVCQSEQSTFSNIESLIGREITRIALPEFLGNAPEYRPEIKGRNNNRRTTRKPKTTPVKGKPTLIKRNQTNS
jgi:hypothetical protein